MGYQSDGKCTCLFDCLTPFCRFWGISTAIVLFGIGADILFHRHYLGVYILVIAFLLLFLETTWVINIFLGLCLNYEGHPCLRYWEAILWLDQWKKSVLYGALSVVMFLEPRHIWMAVIGGAFLVTLALLYLIMTYKTRSEVKETLLGSRESTYDRFDDAQDEIDDSLPDPLAMGDSVANQEHILEV